MWYSVCRQGEIDMLKAIEVKVIYENGELSKNAYTYKASNQLDFEGVEDVYVPMRGKLVKCKIVEVYKGSEALEYLNTLPYPKDKVVLLDGYRLEDFELEDNSVETRIKLVNESEEMSKLEEKFRQGLI